MMKQFFYFILFLATLPIAFSSCSYDPTDDADPLFALVTPDTITVLKVGQKQTYRIEIKARDGQKVENMKVYSDDKTHGEQLLLDTMFTSTPDILKFTFNANVGYDGDVMLGFVIKDVKGNKCTIRRNLKIINGATLESEITPAPELCIDADNAYDLALRKVFKFVPAETTNNADLYIEKTADGFKLRSDSELLFAKANTTSAYVNATIKSLNDKYVEIQHEESVNGLEANNVIIFGNKENVMGVLIIKSIDDVNNKVVLGIKLISTN